MAKELKDLPVRLSNSAVLDELLSLEAVDDILTHNFWRFLFLVFDTPRPSTNYDGTDKPDRWEPFRERVGSACKQAGLSFKFDSAGNMIVRNFDASKGSAVLAFQGHMDIVVSKNEDAIHDF